MNLIDRLELDARARVEHERKFHGWWKQDPVPLISALLPYAARPIRMGTVEGPLVQIDALALTVGAMLGPGWRVFPRIQTARRRNPVFYLYVQTAGASRVRHEVPE